MASRLAQIGSLSMLWMASLLAEDRAPLFEGKELRTGETIRLEDYRGHIVLVDFWASWCPPCLESLPAYDRLYRAFRERGFVVVAVNVDEKTSDGLDFLQRHPVTYPVIADPVGDIGIPYGIRTLPRSFILDREGRIIESHRSFSDGDEATLRARISELVGD
ncbi:MAG: TlpA disulfide reductase family protein [Xanthomonadales bacterium]|nr:TlpA disulfide reductase family protein [Xanthomonadales bacterium]